MPIPSELDLLAFILEHTVIFVSSQNPNKHYLGISVLSCKTLSLRIPHPFVLFAYSNKIYVSYEKNVCFWTLSQAQTIKVSIYLV